MNSAGRNEISRNNIFWYMRRNAINDSRLIEIPAIARPGLDIMYTYHTAITKAVFEIIKDDLFDFLWTLNNDAYNLYNCTDKLDFTYKGWDMMARCYPKDVRLTMTMTVMLKGEDNAISRNRRGV